MAKIKTNFSTFSDAELLAKGASILTKMAGNPYFTAPLPPLADVKAALDAFNSASQKMVDGGKDTAIIKNKARATVESFLSTLGLYVQIESNGNELILQSTGYELIRRSATVVLGKPVNFFAKAGDVAGSTRLSFQTAAV